MKNKTRFSKSKTGESHPKMDVFTGFDNEKPFI